MTELLEIRATNPGGTVIAHGPVGPGAFARIFLGSADATSGIEVATKDCVASRILVTREALPELVYFASQVCEALATDLDGHEGEVEIGFRRDHLPSQTDEVVAWAVRDGQVAQFVMQLGNWEDITWTPAAAELSTCSIFLPVDVVSAFAAVVADAMAVLAKRRLVPDLEAALPGERA